MVKPKLVKQGDGTVHVKPRLVKDIGGGGGSTNYNDLQNKPKINNVELNGNKTSDDLGLASKTYVNGKVSEIIPELDFELPGNIYVYCEGHLGSNIVKVVNYNGEGNFYSATIEVSELDFEIAEDHGFDVNAGTAYQMVTTIHNNETITKNIAYVGLNLEVEDTIEYISTNSYVDTSSFSYDSQTQTLSITIS